MKFLIKTVFLVLALLVFGSGETWAKDPKGVVIVGHGLNNNFMAMKELSKTLEQMDLEVVPLILAGHNLRGAPGTEMPDVTANMWLQDFAAVYTRAQGRAASLHKPLYFLGYSLSTVVGLASMHQDSRIRFSKMILLAPPLVTKWYTGAVGTIIVRGINIPSATPKDLRAHDSTSVGAYKSLFELQKKAILDPSIAQTPSLVFFDQRDELVDVDASAREIKNTNTAWQINMLDAEGIDGYRYHHLLVDPRATGSAVWKTITDGIHHLLN